MGVFKAHTYKEFDKGLLRVSITLRKLPEKREKERERESKLQIKIFFIFLEKLSFKNILKT